MKYAIISDLHANESALRHVLADASANGAERVVCLGDVVGYGPLPAETVALVRRAAAVTLAGNHDDAVSGRQGADGFVDLAGDAVRRHRRVLDAESLAWLKELPYTCEIEGAIAAHGDFVAPANFNYVESEETAAQNFAATDVQVMFVGHTHVPCFFLTGRSGRVYRMDPQDFALEDGKRYIVNPGSVGYPRESDGRCISSYVLYDSTACAITFRFLPFAVSSMLQRGVGTRRRMWQIVGLAALVGAALGGAAFYACRTDSAATSPVAAVPAPDLAVARKSVTLRPGDRFVRANLKLDRKGDPVVLHIEYKSSTGDLLGEITETVKKSSVERRKIPKGAISAHFTLMRQKTAPNPVIRQFEPDSY